MDADELADAREREIARILDGHERAMATLAEVLEESGCHKDIAQGVSWLYGKRPLTMGPIIEGWLDANLNIGRGVEKIVAAYVDQQRRDSVIY